MKKVRVNGIQSLADRAGVLERWIINHEEHIEESKKERDKALISFEKARQVAQSDQTSMIRNRMEANAGIASAEQDVAVQESILENARAALRARENNYSKCVDALAKAATTEQRATAELVKERSRWHIKLTQETELGEYRRKLGQLARLQERIAKKQEQASRPTLSAEEIYMGEVPEHLGTPTPKKEQDDETTA